MLIVMLVVKDDNRRDPPDEQTQRVGRIFELHGVQWLRKG